MNRTLAEKLESRPGVRRAINNLGWLFWDRLLRIGLGLLITSGIARVLGPGSYGMLNWASAWITFYGILAVLGLDSIVVRDIVKFPEEKNSILGTAFLMKLVGAIVAVLLSVGTLVIFKPHIGADLRTVKILVFLLSLPYVFQAFDTIDFWYQSQIASKYAVYARSSAFLIMALVKLWLIYERAPVVTFAAALLAESVLAAIGLYITYIINRHSIREWQFDWRWSKSLLADSWPVMLTGIAISIQARIDQVMLGIMVGQAEVGQFSAAIRMIEAFGFIPMVVQTAVAPLIVKAKKVSEDVYYSRLCNLYRLMFLSFVMIAVPLFFAAVPITYLFLGSKYHEAGTLLSLFGIRLFFTNFGVARSVFVMSENLFRYTLVTAILGTVTNVGLNYLLIPHYRSIGSIWAMIASFFVTTFLTDAFYQPVRRNLREMLRAIVTPWKVSLA